MPRLLASRAVVAPKRLPIPPNKCYTSSMVVQTKPLAEVTQIAIRVLCREIGLADTMRFVGQFAVGYGNYTEERDEMFGDMTLDDMIAEIKRRRSQPNTHQSK